MGVKGRRYKLWWSGNSDVYGPQSGSSEFRERAFL